MNTAIDPSVLAESLTLDYLRNASPRERHLYVARSNYDSNSAGLQLIADDPGTDRATALMMFWALGARYLAQFADDNEVPDWQRQRYTLVRTLESRFLSGFYASGIYFDPCDGPVPPDDYADLPLRRSIPEPMYAVVEGQDWVDLDDPGYDEGLPMSLAEQIWHLFDEPADSSSRTEASAPACEVEDDRFGRFVLQPSDGAYVEERPVLIGGRSALTILFVSEYTLASSELAPRLQALLPRLDQFDATARRAMEDALRVSDSVVANYLDFHLEEVPEVLPWLAGCARGDEATKPLALLQQLALRRVLVCDPEGTGTIRGPITLTLDYMVGDGHSPCLTDEILCVKMDEQGQVLRLTQES
jgi:hypothetical protein